MPLSSRGLYLNKSFLGRSRPGSRRNWSSAISSRDDYFITTPIFYVNSSPHIGHLYTSLLADAAQRFQRLLCKKDVLFMTGTDEHGSKIQQAAANFKTEPIDYCDKISSEYKDLFKQFGVDYSHFIRTTNKNHINAVHHFWNQLLARGHIYKGQYSGWYCTADEAFLTDTQLTEVTNPDGTKVKVSAESGRPVEWTEETNYKFKLSSMQDDLLHWLKDERVVYPDKFHKQLVGWVKEGSCLQDVSVSRPISRVRWGVPVPGSTDQTVYVWLDALVSYLTAAGYPDLRSWPPTRQILGKDILKFHGVYWPAFLIGAGLEPPSSLVVHSHWTVDDEKMSKTLGNVVSPVVAAKDFSAAGLRYFLLREGTLHSDANYSNEKVLRKLNAELADTLGNLLNRCTGKTVNANQHFPAFNPEHYKQYCEKEASGLVESLQRIPDLVGEHYGNFNYYKGVDVIISCLHEANKFFETNQPWKLRKSADCADHLNCVLHVTMETLRVCGIALQPIVPQIAQPLLDKLSIPLAERSWDDMRRLSVNETTSLLSDNVVLYKRVLANK
ncbi:methionine--tRNA ligase, mitochondrial-like [Macrosteles quadrilineatus]|uniref:methionine--tRNA ligase, mitochondrial-like n=1 Tax=Macrosteles quadrilineatus TaxID=74068 RepID=UPI0023E333A0|nr:methionine--tRNA ligase, mitochondrial-like [Macrosteles quadrilineatus]